MTETPKVLLALAAAGMIAAVPATALAVPSYGGVVSVGANDGGPDITDGIYFGSGNVDGNFTIDTSNGIEVALRAKNRTTLATIDGSSGVYRAPAGFATAPGAPKAGWNYEFSVNVRAGGGLADLDDFFVVLEVDTDNGAGTSFTTIDVLNNWPDNSYWNGSLPVRTGTAPLAGEYGVQQSANPLFGDSGFMPGFDVNASGVYDIRLSVYEKTDLGGRGDLLAQTDIQVAIPVPATALLMGLGLMGVGFFRRKSA